MRAGELRQSITIQQATISRNSFGEAVNTWSTVATVWAKVEMVSGTEKVDLQYASALLTHKVTIRALAGVVAKMRIAWHSRLFDINAVLDDNVGRQMVLLCSEVING
jgi:SPP1 family predicted phage head-tail adaptor